MRTVRTINPLSDPRWTSFVEGQRRASIFHTRDWLEALHRTYGYRPVAFTTSSERGPLENALLAACITSSLTGRRIVALPFSDHCQPLVESAEDLEAILESLQDQVGRGLWRYVEVRPTCGAIHGFSHASSYYWHRMDLRASLGDIFQGLDKSCVQRRIRRAEQAGLVEKCGRSEELLGDFFRLLILTRRRHQLPPQPLVWFRNVIQSLGDAVEIRVAYAQERVPVAAIFNLRFKETVVYKYGCSDARFSHLGATPFLLWRAVKSAKANGAAELDLGRSDEDNPGLMAFKNHWTSNPVRLFYWRFPHPDSACRAPQAWVSRFARAVCSHLPDRVLAATGELLYRHIG